jgi:cold shock protein
VSEGVVREYHDEEGWGVIDGPDVPGGCWVHFSAIEMAGYRKLDPGEHITFAVTEADQGGFRFRADRVWRTGQPTGDAPRSTP